MVQFVYGRLSGDRELTVMRTAGMSQFALARPALAVACMAMLCCYALNVWIVPASYSAFREYQFAIRNRLAAFLLQEGVFTEASDDLTVYVRSRDVDGTLRGILVEDTREKNTRATILAERGRLIDGPNGPAVLLENGSREEVDSHTGRLDVLTFAQNTVDLTGNSKNDNVRYRDVTEMSMHELFHPETSALLPQDAGKFLVEANRRLSSPLTAVSFAMVALLSVLAGSFRRHGNLLRPLVAAIAVTSLLAVQLAVANLAARSTALIPLVWLAAVGPGVLCAWGPVRPGRAGAPARPRRAGGRPRGQASVMVSATLSLYIARQFSAAVLAMTAALSGLVSLFDFIELLRRAATKPEATFGLVLQIAALRLPYIMLQIMPFAILLGGILAFWRLTRSSELIVARAAGISAWQFLSAPVLCAALLGVVATALISPLSSAMLARAETLDNTYLRTGGGPLALAGGQLWLRQSDRELVPNGSRSSTPAASACTRAT